MSLKFKVILLGDTGVGKTSIARRQAQGTFDIKMTPTIGASHLRASMTIGKRDVDLMLWDTAGQEEFASLVPMYARSAHVCVIVSSIVNPDSCDHVGVWRDRLYSMGEQPPIVIAINKMDLLDEAPMTVEDVKAKFTEFPFLYFVSAKTGDCVEHLFTEVAQLALKGKEKTKSSGMDLSNELITPERGCC
jgi:small GTP-binding protein